MLWLVAGCKSLWQSPRVPPLGRLHAATPNTPHSGRKRLSCQLRGVRPLSSIVTMHHLRVQSTVMDMCRQLSLGVVPAIDIAVSALFLAYFPLRLVNLRKVAVKAKIGWLGRSKLVRAPTSGHTWALLLLVHELTSGIVDWLSSVFASFAAISPCFTSARRRRLAHCCLLSCHRGLRLSHRTRFHRAPCFACTLERGRLISHSHLGA